MSILNSKDYIYPASLLCDFYKISHREQYPKNTEVVYSTWTPRISRLAGIDKVVAFGFQGFVKEFLLDYFNEYFFSRPKKEVVDEYRRFIKYTLGHENPETQHIEKLYDLGYVPVLIKAVKEGTLVPIRVPMLTIENTKPEFFWLTNYLETLLSCQLWMPSTSATLALEYRKIMDQFCDMTGGAKEFVQFCGHDFSMRGLASLSAAQLSGAGHLLAFTGTDTPPAVLYLERYYNANIEKELVGTAIPATEHSVMEVFGRNEYESYKYLMTEVYPIGFLSIVSDTWDLWSVLDNVVKPLKDTIMARDGRVVIRPDSGDPVKIMCGDPNGETENERKGVVEIMWDIFGGFTTDKGFKHLDPHVGCIYGEAITIDSCRDILQQLADKGFASTNMVFGIGSYTYQRKTRDDFGFSLKSTYAVVGGEERKIYKDPVTDKDSIKKSQKGLVVVTKDDNGNIKFIDNLNRAQQKEYESVDLLEPLFKNGQLLREDSLSEIRARLFSQL
jgi:nicotinamide phosphoribosyltransferase